MMKRLIKETAKKYFPKPLQRFLIRLLYRQKKEHSGGLADLQKEGLSIRESAYFIDVYDNSNRCVRISQKHKVYIYDILNSFDYYFSSVKPLEIDNLLLVDFSTPRFHEVWGYDLHPIMFSSFAEPTVTTQQYLGFARLKEGSVVLDLGAYSGLTSILFDQLVGKSGRVVSVDADQLNIKCRILLYY